MTYTSGETIVASRIEDRNDKNQVNGYIGLDSQKMPPSQILMPFNLLKVAASGNIFDMTQSNSGNLSINNSGGSLTLNVLGQYNSVANINSANKYTLGHYSGIPLITTFRIDSISLASGICARIGYGNITGVIDSYPETNQDSYAACYSGGPTKVGQAVANIQTNDLSSVIFYLKKTGSPVGNMTVSVFACVGTPGTDGGGSGLALATSNVINASTLTTSYQNIEFAFTPAYTLEANTNYVIALEFSDGNVSNYVNVGIDITTTTHAGNYTYYQSSWTTNSAIDTCFYLIGSISTLLSTLLYAGITTRNGGQNWVFKTHNGTTATSSNIAMVSSNDVLTIYLTTARAALIKNNSWLATHTTNIPSNLVMGKLASLENLTSSQYSGTITLGFMG